MQEISFRNDILPLKDKLFRLALRITFDRAEAEDVVQETLDYHPDTGISEEWLERNFNCPIELLGHGALPHRILAEHKHGDECGCCNCEH